MKIEFKTMFTNTINPFNPNKVGPFFSYFKKNLSNINITLYNC